MNGNVKSRQKGMRYKCNKNWRTVLTENSQFGAVSFYIFYGDLWSTYAGI